jgi:hypothetical protein
MWNAFHNAFAIITSAARATRMHGCRPPLLAPATTARRSSVRAHLPVCCVLRAAVCEISVSDTPCSLPSLHLEMNKREVDNASMNYTIDVERIPPSTRPRAPPAVPLAAPLTAPARRPRSLPRVPSALRTARFAHAS